MKITKIEISLIPSRQPILLTDTLEFKEVVYLDTTSINADVEVTEWDGKKDIPVFARIHDAYKFEVFVKNDVFAQIENMKVARSVKIYFENGDIHDAKVTEIAPQNADSTFFKLVTIEYYDRSSLVNSNQFDYANYPELLDVVNTELKLENVSTADGVTPIPINDDTNWDNIINVSGEYIQNSNLWPVFPEDDKQIKSDSETGTERRNSIFYQKRIQFRGYFNTEVANDLHTYLSICNKITITYNGTPYILSEQVEVEREQIGTECIRIDFIGKVTNKEYYYYG